MLPLHQPFQQLLDNIENIPDALDDKHGMKNAPTSQHVQNKQDVISSLCASLWYARTNGKLSSDTLTFTGNDVWDKKH